ncbi:hypothetical protein IW261DRAFT_125946 [Armillaria novae-zelandiae]|uniref:Uncharacterized protein n=1 Tax=Armillaria novae-zelandiae TaxID=153914 RepID=A0AA39UBD7_9AGAR|nr:hypothetical protein IW261DRAFT_125946 [Armillaria novae-zelandiae]
MPSLWRTFLPPSIWLTSFVVHGSNGALRVALDVSYASFGPKHVHHRRLRIKLGSVGTSICLLFASFFNSIFA